MRAKSFSKFCAKYAILKNPHDSMAGMDGCLFGNSMGERNTIQEQDSQHVWTVVECGNHWYITTGFHVVNRIGFLVTAQAWELEEEFQDYLYD